MIFITIILTFCYNMTPTKTSLMLMCTSIVMVLPIYSSSGSLFYVCVLIISFSSGLMIMVCYAASLSSQENPLTSNQKIPLWVMGGAFFMETSTEIGSTISTSSFSNSMTVMFMMMVLMLSMKTINTCIMEKSHSLKKAFLGKKEFLFYLTSQFFLYLHLFPS